MSAGTSTGIRQTAAPTPPTRSPRQLAKANAFAFWAQISAITAVFSFFVPLLGLVASLAALVFGIVALVQATSRPARAIIAIVLGAGAAPIALTLSLTSLAAMVVEVVGR
ncbi:MULTISPECIES: hypothetical protein [unclassified Leifsonia]|uniref:hypothetical protein n=1 Tax=unclassified Leifsonia TaxID=2663824 RepID=UPI0006FC7DCE|nr:MULTISPECIES: hypothetical protein [unclassified Leifsonia]KQX08177.1 hypothetical protein ASC59_10965 [Leifsonia sp. Root1293]KRA12459.1 hypothetical protein ASD61_10965 [Leifsonia sp. Root60]